MIVFLFFNCFDQYLNWCFLYLCDKGRELGKMRELFINFINFIFEVVVLDRLRILVRIGLEKVISCIFDFSGIGQVIENGQLGIC